MKTIFIVIKHYGGESWLPVYSSSTRQECIEWVVEETAKSQRSGLGIPRMQINTCPFINR